MMAVTFGQVEADEQDPTGPLPQRTALQFLHDMQDELRRAKIRTVRLRDAQRPVFQLICQVPTDMSEVFELDAKATEAATEPGTPAQEIIHGCMQLARYTRVLRINGMPTSDDDGGSPFADPALQEQLGVAGMKGASWRAVRELFITDGGAYDDGAIVRLIKALTDESGLTRDSVTAEKDPT